MADTRFLKSKVEEYVRGWLEQRFGKPFRKVKLPLSGVQGEPKDHEFDAVSEDGPIVCGIASSSWTTSGGKRGAGKIAKAYMEIYFLSLVAAKAKFLVLTDGEFFQRLSREAQGKLAVGIGLLYCELPDALAEEVAAIRTKSRRELGSDALRGYSDS